MSSDLKLIRPEAGILRQDSEGRSNIGVRVSCNSRYSEDLKRYALTGEVNGFDRERMILTHFLLLERGQHKLADRSCFAHIRCLPCECRRRLANREGRLCYLNQHSRSM